MPKNLLVTAGLMQARAVILSGEEKYFYEIIWL